MGHTQMCLCFHGVLCDDITSMDSEEKGSFSKYYKTMFILKGCSQRKTHDNDYLLGGVGNRRETSLFICYAVCTNVNYSFPNVT